MIIPETSIFIQLLAKAALGYLYKDFLVFFFFLFLPLLRLVYFAVLVNAKTGVEKCCDTLLNP
jgi:hypothetical protein